MLPQALPASLLPGLVGAPLVCACAAYQLLPFDSRVRWAVTIAAAFAGLAIVGPLPFVGRFGFLWATVTGAAFFAALVTSRILLDARRKSAAAISPEVKP